MGSRYLGIVSWAASAWLGPGAASVLAQPLKIENVYPRQIPRGQTTTVHVVVATRDDIQRAELSPSEGVTISRILRGETFQNALTWTTLTIDVAPEAVPGDRQLVLQLPAGRTIPSTLTIPSHVPTAADLRVIGTQASPPIIGVEITATDSANDLGTSPYVWFIVSCGDMPLPGVLRGSVTPRGNGAVTVRAQLPYPPLTSAARCELQTRVADTHGHESATLTATVDVAASVFLLAAVTHGTAGTAFAQDWVEIVNLEDRFAVTFPVQPTVTDTSWQSQFGAVLPARVYRAVKGDSHYAATVVDYRPVERLLVERSRSCASGANTCQGIADWGVGYWKTDIRGALLYVLSKYLERDAKITALTWNGIALVQGIELRLTNGGDQSRTFVSIYMHEDRLIIVEATVPRNEPPPVAFNESLNWLDAQGRPVRYQATYVNMPDVPRPLPRGAVAPPPVGGR